jgi:hypothetical protein
MRCSSTTANQRPSDTHVVQCDEMGRRSPTRLARRGNGTVPSVRQRTDSLLRVISLSTGRESTIRCNIN